MRFATSPVVDVRKLQRSLKLTSTSDLLERLGSIVRGQTICDSCRGDGYYDNDSRCLSCNGTGRDRTIRVYRLHDRYRDAGRQIICSRCHEQTHSSKACESCGQAFIQSEAVESTLTLRLVGGSEAA